MNNTNRALNRILLIVAGLTALAAGLAVLIMTASHRGVGSWRRAVSSIQERAGGARTVDVSFLGLPDTSWLLLAVPVAAMCAIVLLLVFILRQGHGRTDRVVSALPLSTGSADGTLTVDATVAGDALQEALSGAPAVSGAAIAVYRVRGRPALRLTVTPRRGIDPARVLPGVERAICEWDGFLGQRVPVVVHLRAGVQTVFSAPSRSRTVGLAPEPDSVTAPTHA